MCFNILNFRKDSEKMIEMCMKNFAFKNTATVHVIHVMKKTIKICWIKLKWNSKKKIVN